jgi:hypothetical protein
MLASIVKLDPTAPASSRAGSTRWPEGRASSLAEACIESLRL